MFSINRPNLVRIISIVLPPAMILQLLIVASIQIGIIRSVLFVIGGACGGVSMSFAYKARNPD